MAITAGSSLNSVPAAKPQTLESNYIDFNQDMGWAQQYLPDLMEKEAEVFGPRTISGFLSKVGAEEAMTSDQVIWSEQGRLHLSYKGHIQGATGGTASGGQIEIEVDIDGNDIGANHGIRVNDTIIVANSEGVVKCLVEAVDTGSMIDVLPYDFASLNTAGLTTTGGTQDTTILVYGSEFGKGVSYNNSANSAATDQRGANEPSFKTFSNKPIIMKDYYDTTILVYGSEFGKGVSYNNSANSAATDQRGANEPSFKTFSNKPIIMKDYYEVSGSDASRIGWVEITGEEGQSGYLWYLKAEADTRARFNDYLEMSMLESELNLADSQIDGNALVAGSTAGAGNVGTEGLFSAIEKRGNVTSGVTGVNAATDLAEFDAILAEFDKQGAIEENMLFVNRATSLAFDDMLASMNSYGAGGTSYGVFENDEDMALNLGFSGFRRGSYDFYKSDFRYLNDLATRGGINAAAGSNAIRGVIIPAGTSTVYDQQLGKNLKRPFLHVRYRASQTDDRRMKTWTTGSVGASTSALDAMQIHMLSERCLVTQGANNFMLMK